jgi:beta-lactamase regulating signal transducer with metallopeptidase domain
VDATFVWLVALSLRSTVVLAAALGLGWLLRRSSADARHRLLTLTAVGLLGLPTLPGVLPSFELPVSLLRVEFPSPIPVPAVTPLVENTGVGFERSRTAPAPSRAGVAAAAPAAETAGDSSQRDVFSPAAFGAAAVMVWLIGVVAALVGLGRALLRERRLLAAARLLSGRWLETLDEVRRAFALARPVRLFVTDAIEAPLAGGWLRPAVLLPAIAESWTADRRRLVLQHELVHIVRGDGLRRLAWRLVAALYWFHPLARIAERQARLAGEQACDEAVVGLGTQPSLYARHLVEIAEALRGSPAVFASALPMVERNQLERRVVMILDASRSSSRGRGVGIASLAILVATVACAAAAAPAARARAPVVMTTGEPVVAKPRQTEPTESTRSFQQADTIVERTVAASPGETISIRLCSGGGVTIRSWNQSQVRVRGIVSGPLARQTEVLIARVGGGVELRTITPEYRGDWIDRNSFEIWVPTRFNFDISSPGGEISISGVEGRFSGNTAGGRITLDNVTGRADLTTGGGEVSVTNSNLEGSVSTGGGRAVVHNTSGGVSVTSGSGPVIRDGGSVTRVDGVGGLDPVTGISGQPASTKDGRAYVSGSGPDSVTLTGGAIRFDNLPNGGVFTTYGGEIDIGAVGGNARFATGGGNVRIMNASGDLSVATGVGSVEISVIGAGARNISVATSLGRAVIELPASIDARLDIESGYTGGHGKPVFGEVPKIESDFPVNLSEREDRNGNGTPRWYVTASGTIGSGRGLIKIRTMNGDVVIRRR